MNEIKDNRAEGVKYPYMVKALDSVLSNFECVKKQGQKSYAAWACRSLEDAEKVMRHIEIRRDMKYVGIVSGTWTPKTSYRLTIYTVDPGDSYLK